MLLFILRVGVITCLLAQLIACSSHTRGILHDRFTDYTEEESVPALMLPHGLALISQDTHYYIPKLPKQDGIKNLRLYPPGSRLQERK